MHTVSYKQTLWKKQLLTVVTFSGEIICSTARVWSIWKDYKSRTIKPFYFHLS